MPVKIYDFGNSYDLPTLINHGSKICQPPGQTGFTAPENWGEVNNSDNKTLSYASDMYVSTVHALFLLGGSETQVLDPKTTSRCELPH